MRESTSLSTVKSIKLKNSAVFVSSACLLLLLPYMQGCATLSDRQQTEMQGTGTGALIGGVLGSVLGDNTESVVAGTLVGAIIGNIYGKHVADKKAQYKNSESYMNAVIAESDKMLAAAREHRETLTKSITDQNRQLASLKRQSQNNRSLNKQLEKQVAKNKKDIDVTNQLISAIDQEIITQKNVVKKERNLVAVSYVSRSETNITAMESEKRQLELLKAQLASLDYKRVY